jgi:hypothetical protein
MNCHPNPAISMTDDFSHSRPLTRFVALCNVQIDSSLSSRSPKVYGKELPLAIADATADFKKSIEHQAKIAKSSLKEQITQSNISMRKREVSRNINMEGPEALS